MQPHFCGYGKNIFCLENVFSHTCFSVRGKKMFPPSRQLEQTAAAAGGHCSSRVGGREREPEKSLAERKTFFPPVLFFLCFLLTRPPPLFSLASGSPRRRLWGSQRLIRSNLEMGEERGHHTRWSREEGLFGRWWRRRRKVWGGQKSPQPHISFALVWPTVSLHCFNLFYPKGTKEEEKSEK